MLRIGKHRARLKSKAQRSYLRNIGTGNLVKALIQVCLAVSALGFLKLTGTSLAGGFLKRLLGTQGRDDQDQQSPEAQAQTEDRKQEHKQVTAATQKGWISVTITLLQVAITFGTTAVSVFFQHRYDLSVLLTLICVAVFILLIHLLLRQHVWREEHHRKPLIVYSFLMGGVALIALFISVRPGQPQHTEARGPTTNVKEQENSVESSPHLHKVFTIRELSFVFLPVYPQPLLYVYRHSAFVTGSPSEQAVAPVGLALNLEVVNDRPTATKIKSYVVEFETGENKWTPISRLPMTDPRDIYFVDGEDFRSCVKFDFKPNIFDKVASQKTLLPGEPLDGWMFFEWPVELLENNRLRNVRVRLTNSQGETAEAVFNTHSGDNGRGESSISEGSFGAEDPEAKMVDLSHLPIRPFSGG